MEKYTLPDNYCYFYHTDEYFILPNYPESISDSLATTFGMSNPLSRPAPIYSYSYSGPRSVTISLKLHRDMMNEFNCEKSYVKILSNSSSSSEWQDIGATFVSEDGSGYIDYIDVLINKLQSIALPKYTPDDSGVTPPMIAVRFGETLFVKGVVTSGISITYNLPILSNNKYALVDISFTVSEVQPFDAESVGSQGSFRGVTSGLLAKIERTT